mgnify:CR=1 FL=1
MITEVKFIGITPFNLNKSLLPKIERFFEGSKKALIIRLSESSYSESFIKKVINLSKKNQSIIIFNFLTGAAIPFLRTIFAISYMKPV